MKIYRRYGNRKIYDASISKYTSINALIHTYKETGTKFQVINHVDGSDVTGQCLLEAIAVRHKQGSKIDDSVLFEMVGKQ